MADQLTLLLEDSPVRTYRLRGSRPDFQARALDFGTKCFAFVARWCHVTSSWKTSQTSLLESADAGLLPSSVIWPRSGMMCNGIVYRLPPLVRSIHGTGYGLLPTPTKMDGQFLKCFTIQSRRRLVLAGHQDQIWLYLLAVSKFSLTRYCRIIESLMGYPQRWTRLEH